MSRQFWNEAVEWASASGAAISNSTSEALIMPVISIPANYLKDGRLLRFTLRGKLSNIVTSPGTLRFRVRLGGLSGTLVADSGAVNLNTTAQTDIMFEICGELHVRTNGSSGTVLSMAVASVARLATDVPMFMGSAGATAPATATVDLTASQDLAVTAQFGTANAGNTLTGMMYYLEALN